MAKPSLRLVGLTLLALFGATAFFAPNLLLFAFLFLISLQLLLVALFHIFFRRPATPSQEFQNQFAIASFEKWSPEWISTCAEFMNRYNRLGESIFTLVNNSHEHLERNRVVSVVVYEKAGNNNDAPGRVVAVAFFYMIKVVAGYEIAINSTIPMLTGCAYTVAVDAKLEIGVAHRLKREISQAIVNEMSAKYKVLGVAIPLSTKHSADSMSGVFVKLPFSNYNYLDLSDYKSIEDYLSVISKLDKKLPKFKREMKNKGLSIQVYSNTAGDKPLDTLDFERLADLTKIISYKRGSKETFEKNAQLMKSYIVDSPKELGVKVFTVENDKQLTAGQHRVNGFFLSLTENPRCETEQYNARNWGLIAGLDYEALKGTSAYRVLFYSIIQDAFSAGVPLVNLGTSNDDIKAEFGCAVQPFAMYVQVTGFTRLIGDSLAFIAKLLIK